MNPNILLYLGLAMLATAFLGIYLQQNPLSSERVMLNEFEAWKQKHNKKYLVGEESMRLSIYLKNKQFIDNHNSQNNQVLLGLNEFSDLTQDEFKILKLNKVQFANADKFPIVSLSTENLPKSVDWRNKGVITPVMNEGQCGSTLFIVAKEVCEGINAIHTGKLVELSAQQIQDCTPDSAGCCGGYLQSVEDYIVKYGLESEKDYPFKSQEQSCQYNASKVIFHAKSFFNVPTNDSDQLAAAVAQQPVLVCINAADTHFQSYQSGILTDCSPEMVDHCCLAVGYGTEKGVDYWILKNQWGTSWGENGYVRIKKDSGKGLSTCGITTDPAYPVV